MALGVAIIFTQLWCTFYVLRGQERTRKYELAKALTEHRMLLRVRRGRPWSSPAIIQLMRGPDADVRLALEYVLRGQIVVATARAKAAKSGQNTCACSRCGTGADGNGQPAIRAV